MNNQQFNGLILVDKPSGISSHDVVDKVRKIFRTKAVGHTGTLDPLASGLMVCLLNEGTKLSQYILEGDKAYIVKLKFGVTTDTYDISGKVLNEKKDIHLSRDSVWKSALELQGEFDFEVPIYSAAKVAGKKLYEYAREGQEIELPVKKMKFWDIQFLSFDDNVAEFFIRCSKGSFIRTWVHQMGMRMECGATMVELRRMQSSCYDIKSAMTLEKLSEVVAKGDLGLLRGALVDMKDSLPGVKKIRIKGMDQTLLLNGQISHRLRSVLISLFNPEEDEFVQIISGDTGVLLALISLVPEKGFTVKRVFKS